MKSRESRLTRLETLEDALDPETAWERTAGLCALLQARALLPPRAPLDEAALEADDTVWAGCSGKRGSGSRSAAHDAGAASPVGHPGATLAARRLGGLAVLAGLSGRLSPALQR